MSSLTRFARPQTRIRYSLSFLDSLGRTLWRAAQTFKSEQAAADTRKGLLSAARAHDNRVASAEVVKVY